METHTLTQKNPVDFWNERYSSYLTVYGDAPNAFFKEQIEKLPAGKLLLPGEGEGRNAIFAATLGWNVDAFDISEAARSKALANASRSDVTIHYTRADIHEIILPTDTYDAVALIYFHLPENMRRDFHRRVISALKPGGHLILEAFTKDQLRNTSGGPKEEGLLFDLAELEEDFEDLEITVAREEPVRLNEGPFHQGRADVVRIFATKV